MGAEIPNWQQDEGGAVEHQDNAVYQPETVEPSIAPEELQQIKDILSEWKQSLPSDLDEAQDERRVLFNLSDDGQRVLAAEYHRFILAPIHRENFDEGEPYDIEGYKQSRWVKVIDTSIKQVVFTYRCHGYVDPPLRIEAEWNEWMARGGFRLSLGKAKAKRLRLEKLHG